MGRKTEINEKIKVQTVQFPLTKGYVDFLLD